LPIITFFAKQNQTDYKTSIVFQRLIINSNIGYFLDNKGRLAERAANMEDKYLQAITNAREAAEKANDRETVMKRVELNDEIQDKIVAIDKERRQKVLDSQVWALEKEIEIYGGAIEKVKALVIKWEEQFTNQFTQGYNNLYLGRKWCNAS
jgi:hypothetical protein